MIFGNRQEAGKRLAVALTEYTDEHPLVLALPRGGVPIGFEVAEILQAYLDVIVARKIGAPHNSEYGIGAISEGNVQVIDEATVKLLHISREEIRKIMHKEKEELVRRVMMYRGNKPLPSLNHKTVIVVDDGLATGVTARAAIASIKKHQPKQIVFASPVCAYDTTREFQHLVDNVICITTPVDLSAVGKWYINFEQTTDKEVLELLRRNHEKEQPSSDIQDLRKSIIL